MGQLFHPRKLGFSCLKPMLVLSQATSEPLEEGVKHVCAQTPSLGAESEGREENLGLFATSLFGNFDQQSVLRTARLKITH